MVPHQTGRAGQFQTDKARPLLLTSGMPRRPVALSIEHVTETLEDLLGIDLDDEDEDEDFF
jgi:hypothetical protein